MLKAGAFIWKKQLSVLKFMLGGIIMNKRISGSAEKMKITGVKEKLKISGNAEIKRLENKFKVKKAMVLAGGLGTRFLPETLAVAKELVAICNEPILLKHLRDLVESGISDVLIVGNKLKEESFKNFINPPQEYLDKIVAGGKLHMLDSYHEVMDKLKITYVNQDDKFQTIDGKRYTNSSYQKAGSSIAIMAGKFWADGEPFLVINGDDLCVYEDGKSISKEIMDVYAQTGDYVVYGTEVDRKLIYKYSSMVLGDKIGEKGAKMLDIIEKPAAGTEPSNIMGFARYIFNPDVFDRIEKSKPRGNGEYCITDVLSQVAREGHASTCIFDGNYFDCGSIAGYTLANAYFGLKDENSKDAIVKGLEYMLSK